MDTLKKILVIGAGRSSSSLIRYLVEGAEANDWFVTLADRDLELAERKILGSDRATAYQLEADHHELRRELIGDSDLVISMLPAFLHMDVARDAVELGVHMITPSYVSKEMKALHDEASRKGIILLNEMGVDPGIDHMSAMRVIHAIQNDGGKLIRFESFTGGLIAPESDNNPWHYKFTWNPRNVMMAGMGGTAQYIQNGRLKYIPPFKTFERYKDIEIEGHGTFEGYANRDSLSYRSVYGLEDVPTIYRGTLRGKGFCDAWNVFVQLGMTTEDFEVECGSMTYRDFINSFLMYDESLTVEEKLKRFQNVEDQVFELIQWTGIFEEKAIGLEKATPARILQELLVEKWSLEEGDKDMIVMWHRFDYEKDGETHQVHSSMVSIGKDETYTAMSETVGLPVGMAAKRILNGEFKLTGVQLPILPEVYLPILEELESYGIRFNETEVS